LVERQRLEVGRAILATFLPEESATPCSSALGCVRDKRHKRTVQRAGAGYLSLEVVSEFFLERIDQDVGNGIAQAPNGFDDKADLATARLKQRGYGQGSLQTTREIGDTKTLDGGVR
jgi:hypothetical protein